MKKQIYTLATILMMSLAAQAQVGIGTSAPTSSSMLDVTSTTKGFLMPRMTTTERIAIPSPTAGLQVYDTVTNTIWYHNGTVWVNSGINAVEPWFNQATNTGATSNAQNIYQMGNVGIGTSAPTQRLEVAGWVQAYGSGGNNLFRSLSGTPAAPGADLRLQNNVSSGGVGFWSNHPLELVTNSIGRVAITADGKVGVGTGFTVKTKLEVNGNAVSLPATTGTDPAGGTVARFKGSDNALIDLGSNGASGQWIQATDAGALGTNYALLLNPNGGNVGVGTATPLNRFQVTSASASTSGIRMTNLTTAVTTKAASAATLGVDSNGDVVIASNTASTAAKNFIYMPSIAIDVSANVTGATKNLYSLYSTQFSTPKAASTGAPAAIPVLPAATDFYYYVTYADPAVFTGTMSIDASGVLTYNVTASAVTDATFINIVLVPKN